MPTPIRTRPNMLLLRNKIFCSVLALPAVILLSACAGVPQWTEIAQSEGVTLEEKVQELVSRGASRSEVLATLGYPTGYTSDTLSYTANSDVEPPQTWSFPRITMNYPDPGHRGDYRWVLAFDEYGMLYNYRRVPIDRSQGTYVFRYLRDEISRQGVSWGAAYQAGFTTIECTNTDRCWAAGGAGLVLETTDGGKSWVSHASGTDKHKRLSSNIPSIYSMSFPDSANGWITGHDSFMPVGGLILHSPDGGKNWLFQLKSDSVMFPRHALWSVHFNDNRQGWAVGGRGTILHTDDGGGTWSDQSSGTKAALLSVGFCNGQSGWAVGSSRTILHTSDAGQSWRAQAISLDQLPSEAPERYPFPFKPLLSVYPYEDNLTSLSFVDCHRGWVVGDHGTILHTEDGGLTWLAQLSGTTEDLNAVRFISKHQGWAVGNRGVILITTDGGKEWKPQSSGTRERLLSLSFVDAGHGWIGGTFGTILHTRDGGKTWTKQCLTYACAGKAAEKFYWHPWLK